MKICFPENLCFRVPDFKDQSLIVSAKAELQSRVGEDFEYKALLGDRKPPLDYRKN